jgi:hypothetical protein
MVVGIEVNLEHMQAGLDSMKPALLRIDEVKARRSRSVTKRAVPSAVFSAMLPEEAVGNHDIDVAARDLVAFGKSVEAQWEVVGLRSKAAASLSASCP